LKQNKFFNSHGCTESHGSGDINYFKFRANPCIRGYYFILACREAGFLPW